AQACAAPLPTTAAAAAQTDALPAVERERVAAGDHQPAETGMERCVERPQHSPYHSCVVRLHTVPAPLGVRRENLLQIVDHQQDRSSALVHLAPGAAQQIDQYI